MLVKFLFADISHCVLLGEQSAGGQWTTLLYRKLSLIHHGTYLRDVTINSTEEGDEADNLVELRNLYSGNSPSWCDLALVSSNGENIACVSVEDPDANTESLLLSRIGLDARLDLPAGLLALEAVLTAVGAKMFAGCEEASTLWHGSEPIMAVAADAMPNSRQMYWSGGSLQNAAQLLHSRVYNGSLSSAELLGPAAITAAGRNTLLPSTNAAVIAAESDIYQKVTAILLQHTESGLSGAVNCPFISMRISVFDTMLLLQAELNMYCAAPDPTHLPTDPLQNSP